MTADHGSENLLADVQFLLATLGAPHGAPGGSLQVRSPIAGEVIGAVEPSGREGAHRAIEAAHAAFLHWRDAPAPKRGELVRLFGEELRAHKAALGRLVSIEAGKIASEGQGEVQEMIDICDFAVGLSRQLHGLAIASERPRHRMMETWHPLGVTGIISAFNFPVAVWAWNAALALVCGNACVWKPSEKTPLSALGAHALFEKAVARYRQAGNAAPDGLSAVILGGREAGEALVEHPLVPLVSATGSTAMGRAAAPRLARRFARAILELGGNNAAIVCPSAGLDLALRAVAFSAMGTAGQRCTTLRRLFVHESIYDGFMPRLKQAYASAKVGDPRKPETLVGPLIDGGAFEAMQRALEEAKAAGGAVTGGGASHGRLARGRLLCASSAGGDAGTDRAGAARNLRADPLRDALSRPRRRHRDAQRCRAGAFVIDLHQRSAGGRAVPVVARLRLRHRQREYRAVGRGDRRRFRRREGDGRRA